MLTGARLVTDRTAVLAATADHPYARLATGDGGGLTGFLAADAAVWLGTGPRGRAGYAMGDADRALHLLDGLVTVAGSRPPHALHLPRLAGGGAPTGLSVAARDDWDFRWVASAPPSQPGEADVAPLTSADEPAVADLLDRAFPTSAARPGGPRVRRWYGLHDGVRLVACGADCSRGGVGFISGLTVETSARSRGCGAALTAAITRALFTEYDVVALGVLTGNIPAGRLYDRLGFTAVLARTSLVLG